jgi:hypothetical protein
VPVKLRKAWQDALSSFLESYNTFLKPISTHQQLNNPDEPEQVLVGFFTDVKAKCSEG